MTRLSRHIVGAAAVTACAGLLLTSCNTSDNNAAPTTQVDTATEQEASSTQSTQPQSMLSTREDATSTNSGNRNADQTICNTKDLKITTSELHGAAGSQLLDVIFTNTAKKPCTLDGFPGVSLVTDNNGTQLGKAAERETNVKATPVSLSPNSSAKSAVRITNTGALNPTECQPTKADGLRVYPPNETSAGFVPTDNLEGCRGDVSILSVQPITAN